MTTNSDSSTNLEIVNHYEREPEGRLVTSAIRVNGKYYTGLRHYYARRAAIADGCDERLVETLTSGAQGFLTENNVFLHRGRALRYARSIKQVDGIDNDRLTSEDLWDDGGRPVPLKEQKDDDRFHATDWR